MGYSYCTAIRDFHLILRNPISFIYELVVVFLVNLGFSYFIILATSIHDNKKVTVKVMT